MHGHGMRGLGLKYLILDMADREEVTGADIMTRVNERSSGRWMPSPGVIYPALRKLYEDGYLEMAGRDNKKYYKTTEKGKEMVKKTVCSLFWKKWTIIPGTFLTIPEN
jgi:DNA-binding PadR family transcriptional regulator